MKADASAVTNQHNTALSMLLESEGHALVQQKLASAKDRFYASARDTYRHRHPLMARASGFDDAAQRAATAIASPGGASGGADHASVTERRDAIVRGVVATSSVFNVDSSVAPDKASDSFAPLLHTPTTPGAAQFHFHDDDGSTTLVFAGHAGRSTQLGVFAADVAPLEAHIDRVRETAMLATLESNRSRTAHETRQTDAVLTMQAFFRMAIVRKRYLRHKLSLVMQLRALDRLRCCKAALLLSRFCRGHLVRREYAVQRAEIAARRQDNITRRSKAERSSTPVLFRVPPASVALGRCTAEEWLLDVLSRFNGNFIQGVRLMEAGNFLDAIAHFEAHVKTSTTSAKEQSTEFLADALRRRCVNELPTAVLAEYLEKESKNRRRRF